MALPAAAITVGNTTVADVNDGAIIDGTISNPNGSQRNRFAVSRDATIFDGETWSYGTLALSDIPVFDDRFVFAYDAQETGRSPTIDIDDVVLAVGPQVFFDYDEASHGALHLDGSTPTLGNALDFSFSVPVSKFLGHGLTGDSMLTFYWQQSNDSNGPDEWVTVGDGHFDPDQPIDPVPVPPALPLLAAGLGALFVMRRKRTG